MGGARFEPIIRKGALRLLDAQWLIEYAEAGGILSCRQDLPDEAFVTLDALQAACTPVSFLPIIAISYPWLTPSHPDPQGEHLQLVARVLATLFRGTSRLQQRARRAGRWGVFWDFGSLHQHREGVPRTPEETALFQEGLSTLGTIYSHPWTWVFRLTALPPGFPDKYELSAGANVATYNERGWTFVESCWAQLSKSRYNSLDLGRVSGELYDTLALGAPSKQKPLWSTVREVCTTGLARQPPITPERFEEELLTRRFTNGKEDRPLVVRLYRESFAAIMGTCDHLNFECLGWGDREAQSIAELIRSGALCNLEELDLNGNDMSDGGARAIAEAVRSGGVPCCKRILVAGNRTMSKEAVAELRAAVSATASETAPDGGHVLNRNRLDSDMMDDDDDENHQNVFESSYEHDGNAEEEVALDDHDLFGEREEEQQQEEENAAKPTAKANAGEEQEEDDESEDDDPPKGLFGW